MKAIKETLPKNDQEKNKENNKTANENYVQGLKSQYLRVSDQRFKQMLSDALQDGNQIVQCLDTNEKLQFIRQMAETTNQLQYLDLQRHLWQDYHNLSLKEDVWTVRVSKSYAEEHHTCRTCGFPKHVVEKRQQTIQHQFSRTIQELQQQIMELQRYAQEWQPSFDSNLLSQAINECVKKGQHRLRQEFDYRRQMLLLDSNDHHSIREFYQLQPSEEQVCLNIEEALSVGYAYSFSYFRYD